MPLGNWTAVLSLWVTVITGQLGQVEVVELLRSWGGAKHCRNLQGGY